MKDHRKPGKAVSVTVQTLEERMTELSVQYRLLEDGQEKDRVNQQIKETSELLAQLSYYSLKHKLQVKGVVEKKIKI